MEPLFTRMSVMENILAKIQSATRLSEETILELKACVTPCHFPKNHLLIRSGGYCKYAYFIEKGFTRSFWVVDGEEITTSFLGEGGIVFSMDELYYQKPSEEYVETLEEVEAYRISIADLRRLWDTNFELCRWALAIHQDEYRRLHRSHRDRLALPAKERYEHFLQQFPGIEQRVNLGLIASYLGITLSTLSRLRGKI